MTISRGQQELVLDHMVKELTIEELQNIARESIKRVWTEAPQRKEEDWKRYIDSTPIIFTPEWKWQENK